MTGEIKLQIEQLVEMNRALAHDLDLSHKIVAKLSNERDSLRAHVERLESGMHGRGAVRQRQESAGMQRQRNQAMRRAEEADRRASRVEQRLRELALRFGEVEEERDGFRLQLDEMNDAMEEIRLRLSQLPASEAGHLVELGEAVGFGD